MHKTYLLLAVLCLVACGKPARQSAGQPLPFTVECRIKTTPVKNQGNSNLCWLYGMLATIESEHLMAGDSVNLSPDYLARMLLREGTTRYFFSRRQSDLSLRGMAPMALFYMARYGMEPYDSYHGDSTDYRLLARKLMYAARTSRSLSLLASRTETLLDEQINFLPRLVFMLGAQYTPLEFAHSVYRRGEYASLTSFSHHPFYRPFELETPDNRLHQQFLNLPLDSLMRRVERALRSGHPVCWEGDISEPGFCFEQGTATVPARSVTQQSRQRAFERRLTTDDHVMELVGIAHDAAGRRFYIAKNSWGTANPYGGFMFLSEAYVRLKTIAVCLPAER